MAQIVKGIFGSTNTRYLERRYLGRCLGASRFNSNDSSKPCVPKQKPDPSFKCEPPCPPKPLELYEYGHCKNPPPPFNAACPKVCKEPTNKGKKCEPCEKPKKKCP